MGNVSAGMKAFQEQAVSRWFSRAWQDKIAGAFTHSANLAGDKESTLHGLMVNAMQHGMIYVSLGLAPAANEPEALADIEGAGPNAINRVDGQHRPHGRFSHGGAARDGTGDLQTAYLLWRTCCQYHGTICARPHLSRSSAPVAFQIQRFSPNTFFRAAADYPTCRFFE